jgi:hypothetical protein
MRRQRLTISGLVLGLIFNLVMASDLTYIIACTYLHQRFFSQSFWLNYRQLTSYTRYLYYYLRHTQYLINPATYFFAYLAIAFITSFSFGCYFLWKSQFIAMVNDKANATVIADAAHNPFTTKLILLDARFISHVATWFGPIIVIPGTDNYTQIAKLSRACKRNLCHLDVLQVNNISLNSLLANGGARLLIYITIPKNLARSTVQHKLAWLICQTSKNASFNLPKFLLIVPNFEFLGELLPLDQECALFHSVNKQFYLVAIRQQNLSHLKQNTILLWMESNFFFYTLELKQ